MSLGVLEEHGPHITGRDTILRGDAEPPGPRVKLHTDCYYSVRTHVHTHAQVGGRMASLTTNDIGLSREGIHVPSPQLLGARF